MMLADIRKAFCRTYEKPQLVLLVVQFPGQCMKYHLLIIFIAPVKDSMRVSQVISLMKSGPLWCLANTSDTHI